MVMRRTARAALVGLALPVAALAGCGSDGSGGSLVDDATEVTYHFHKEASDLNRVFRLRVAIPDSAATTLQSGNIANATGEIVIKAFATDAGVPGASGVVPLGTPVTATVYMRKTSGNGAEPRRDLAVCTRLPGPVADPA